MPSTVPPSYVIASNMKFFLVCCVLVALSEASDPVPLVLWHGMGDTCCNPISMGRIKSEIEEKVKGIYVFSIQIGSNFVDDELSGFFKNSNEQINIVCEQLSQDPKLKNGFNAMGFSQGGQFLRALVQRCGNITMHNLISVGGQHQGVYGFPKCIGEKYELCNIVRRLLNVGAYISEIQKDLVQAEYWHDPYNLKEYREKCVFLPDINQENSVNPDYKVRLSKLSNFVMVKFLNDTMVDPKESEWFGFYKDGQGEETYTLFESDLYKKDLLGLKILNDAKRLHFLGAPWDHLQMTTDWFMKNLVEPFVDVNFDNVRTPVVF